MSQTWRKEWNGSAHLQHAPIPPPQHPQFDLKQMVRAALDEDSAGIGDITTLATIGKEVKAVGTFLAKADGIIAGLAVADLVFDMVDRSLEVTWTGKDGEYIQKGVIFGTVKGSAQGVLVAERVALNFIQRMSGIATATHLMCKEVQETKAQIIETRKTVPGLRVLDKWAVTIGGGANHRMGLYDMVMIKDNHIAAAGGITAALGKCQAYLKAENLDVPVEVETETLEQVQEVLDLQSQGKAGHVTRIMLDNMAKKDASQPGSIDVRLLEKAVEMVNGSFETEASGNVTLSTVKKIAETGVTFISCGALTHSVIAMDISLKIELLNS